MENRDADVYRISIFFAQQKFKAAILLFGIVNYVLYVYGQ
jgi:hypothetical protein